MMRSLPFQAFAACQSKRPGKARKPSKGRRATIDVSEPMKGKECFGDEFSGIVEERIK
jgi:hypothetical protein